MVQNNVIWRNPEAEPGSATRNLQSSFSLWSGELNESKLDYLNLNVTSLHVHIHTNLPATILE